MSTNLNSHIPATHSLSSEGMAVGLFAATLLLAKKLFSPKPAQPEPMSRADFYAELAGLKDQMHADHLALVEKLDANQRELLAALERLANKISGLEAAFARLAERTAYGSPKPEVRSLRWGLHLKAQGGGSGCQEAL